ncbi:MAG: response regulator transcription factor [Clostridiales bacterium]|nr:response regulator transcription factor [Clostridiales bacterium]HCH67390.1 DNA-binding response regulator [Clostridiales bacterium]
MFNILVVEDDPVQRRLMKAVLTRGGYNVFQACDGNEGMAVLDRQHIDLVVLDVMLPGMNGFEFAKNLRQGGSELPLLMVTARQTQRDKREGFLAGTDDYMTKPVDEEELLLRISALLRRSKIAAEKRIVVGDTELDYNCMTVGEKGVRSDLPQKEFLLLFKLLSYPGQIFTRRQLMDEIWNLDCDTDERTVDVHINRLRDRYRKSEDFEIVTVRGLGYKAVCKK